MKNKKFTHIAIKRTDANQKTMKSIKAIAEHNGLELNAVYSLILELGLTQLVNQIKISELGQKGGE